MSIFTLLTVLFVALKLLGYITWSWLWVLSPFWGAFIFYFALGFLAYAYGYLLSGRR